MSAFRQPVFQDHEVRKSKKQKAAFRAYVRDTAASLGYASHEERGKFGVRNVVVGDPTAARVVFTAHYDTCARMPFPNFITPTSLPIYLLYQLLLTAFIMGVPFVAGILAAAAVDAIGLLIAGEVGVFVFYVGMFVLIWLIMAGPANPHTANDNTSGVVTLLDLMAAVPEDRRDDVAFIFFDLEEMGLLGSSSYASTHKKAMKKTLLLNFDCVSDGGTMLFVLRKGAVPFQDALADAFDMTSMAEPYTATAETAREVRLCSSGVFYPSDQAAFPCGVGVASLRKTRHGLLYMNRIHTSHDTVFDEANIAFLVAGSVRLVEQMTRASASETVTPAESSAEAEIPPASPAAGLHDDTEQKTIERI